MIYIYINWGGTYSLQELVQTSTSPAPKRNATVGWTSRCWTNGWAAKRSCGNSRSERISWGSTCRAEGSGTREGMWMVTENICSFPKMELPVIIHFIMFMMFTTGWWFGTWVLWLSIQLGISSSQVTNSCFSEGLFPYAPWCCYMYPQNWVIFRANVGKYSIHGAYGIWRFPKMEVPPVIIHL